MTIITNKNGLALGRLTSKVDPIIMPKIAKQSELESFFSNQFGNTSAYAILYLNNGIRFARWEKKLAFQPGCDELFFPELQLVRLFCHEKELKIWRTEDGYKGRLRTDSINDKGVDYAIEALQILWGTQTEVMGGGWTRLYEDRGTEIILPFSVAIKPYEMNETEFRHRVVVRTRNYIGSMEYGDKANGQMSFIDSRFLSLVEINDKDFMAEYPAQGGLDV